jgi:hypothetical protein
MADPNARFRRRASQLRTANVDLFTGNTTPQSAAGGDTTGFSAQESGKTILSFEGIRRKDRTPGGQPGAVQGEYPPRTALSSAPLDIVRQEPPLPPNGGGEIGDEPRPPRKPEPLPPWLFPEGTEPPPPKPPRRPPGGWLQPAPGSKPERKKPRKWWEGLDWVWPMKAFGEWRYTNDSEANPDWSDFQEYKKYIEPREKCRIARYRITYGPEYEVAIVEIENARLEISPTEMFGTFEWEVVADVTVVLARNVFMEVEWECEDGSTFRDPPVCVGSISRLKKELGRVLERGIGPPNQFPDVGEVIGRITGGGTGDHESPEFGPGWRIPEPTRGAPRPYDIPRPERLPVPGKGPSQIPGQRPR